MVDCCYYLVTGSLSHTVDRNFSNKKDGDLVIMYRMCPGIFLTLIQRLSSRLFTVTCIQNMLDSLFAVSTDLGTEIISHPGGINGYSFIGFNPAKQIGVVILCCSCDNTDVNVEIH